MKCIKYIAAALLLTVGFASCNNGGDDMGDGTVGKTTVQFAQAEYTSGYGTGMVKVPVTITADKEEDMNSCNVSVKIKPVITGEDYEGTHDETGKPGAGDYAVTSWNLNFPAYAKYYDKKEPTKYYDEATQKWTKTVNLEVKIVNSESDELHITFEIESVTEGVTIGENKQCKVVLEKTVMDRLQGYFSVSYDEIMWLFGADNRFLDYPPETGVTDAVKEQYFSADLSKYPWTQMYIEWVTDPDSGQSFFVLDSDHLMYVFGLYIPTNFDEEREQMYMPSQTIMGGITEEDYITIALYDTEKQEWIVGEDVYFDFDMDTNKISLPAHIALSVSIFNIGEDEETGEGILVHKAEMFPAYKGLKFTKAK